MRLWRRQKYNYTALQEQKAVSAHFTSKYIGLLPFHGSIYMHSPPRRPYLSPPQTF